MFQELGLANPPALVVGLRTSRTGFTVVRFGFGSGGPACSQGFILGPRRYFTSAACQQCFYGCMERTARRTGALLKLNLKCLCSFISAQAIRIRDYQAKTSM